MDGFWILNDDDVVLIDSDYPTLVLRSIQTIPFSTRAGPVSGGWGVQAEVAIPNAVSPLVAAYCTKRWTLCASYWDGTTYRVRFISANGADGATTSDSIKVYVFDNPTDDADFGMLLYDANGKCTFNALQKPMRVVDARTINDVSNPLSINLPAGRNYAQVVVAPYYAWSGTTASPSDPNWSWACRALLVRSRADGCDLDSRNIGEGTYNKIGNPPPTNASTYMNIVSLDVTDYE